MHSFIPPDRLLLGPGPSNVPPRILGALARPTIGHLDPDLVVELGPFTPLAEGHRLREFRGR